MRQLYQGIYQLDLPVGDPIKQVYAYIVVDEKVTLIDVGVPTEACREAMDKQLAEIGLCRRDIDQIILTHHHYDHWAGIGWFDEAIPVYLHERFKRVSEIEAEKDQYMRKSLDYFVAQLGLPAQFGTSALQIFKVDSYHLPCENLISVREGDMIPFMGGVQVLEIPGHASTQIGLSLVEKHVLFSADVLMNNQNLSVWLEQKLPEDQVRQKFMLQYIQTLNRLRNDSFQKFYPGHGVDIEEIGQQIDKRLAHIETKKEQVLRKITANKQSVWEIYTQLYSKRFIEKFFTLTFAEVFGMIDLLCQDNLVEMDESTIPFHVRRKGSI